MSVHKLKTTQKIPADIDKVWKFFSDPANLKVITPDHLDFKILSAQDDQGIHSGQIIEYTVKPILKVPGYWMTEITFVEQRKFFVDEQREGPYSLWHHQHHFNSIKGGTEMKDVVHYKLPFGILGDLVNKLIVKNQLNHIFSYRFTKVEEMFGKWQD
jgi:ligand-binding SRPBCC domain-containing protein